jgi:hypothetical protein
MLPDFICADGNPPTETTRSNDHFTSAAVTGVPSWKRASRRSVKVIDFPSDANDQDSASSGSKVV